VVVTSGVIALRTESNTGFFVLSLEYRLLGLVKVMVKGFIFSY
jgi:hypothetical protein